MTDRNYIKILTPMGELGLYEERGALVRLSLSSSSEDLERPTALLLEAKEQILAYFAGKRQDFDLPLAPAGTKFQQSVWTALQKIPYGETRSYGQIAQAIGNPKASRAVGMANNKNPLPILIPCHRVIGADGRLVGYASGLEIKTFLLEREGVDSATRTL